MERHHHQKLGSCITAGTLSTLIFLGHALPVVSTPSYTEQNSAQNSPLNQSQQPESHDNVALDLLLGGGLLGIAYIITRAGVRGLDNLIKGPKRKREEDEERKRLKSPVLQENLDKVKRDLNSARGKAEAANDTANKAKDKINSHLNEGSKPEKKRVQLLPEGIRGPTGLLAVAVIIAGLSYIAGLPQPPSSTLDNSRQPLSSPAPTIFPSPIPRVTIIPAKNKQIPRAIQSTKKLGAPTVPVTDTLNSKTLQELLEDPDYSSTALIMMSIFLGLPLSFVALRLLSKKGNNG